MTTITRFTKEQLLKRLEEQMSSARYALSFVQDSEILRDIEMDLRITEISRASLEAEPDYIRYDCGCCGWETLKDWSDNDVCPKCNHKPMGKTELFTAPPAPVVLAEKTDRDYVTDCHGLPSIEDLGHQRGWNDYRAAMLQAGNSTVAPDGYVLVPKKLTAENGAKGVLSGEFSETKFINCPECFGDDDCETCDGSGRIEITIPVTWTTIKAIWAKGVEHFVAAPKQETL